jgi:hypothetical protein
MIEDAILEYALFFLVIWTCVLIGMYALRFVLRSVLRLFEDDE